MIFVPYTWTPSLNLVQDSMGIVIVHLVPDSVEIAIEMMKSDATGC